MANPVDTSSAVINLGDGHEEDNNNAPTTSSKAFFPSTPNRIPPWPLLHFPKKVSTESVLRKLRLHSEELRQRAEQSAKAVDCCLRSRGFQFSFERVEAERVLLLSTLMHAATEGQIRTVMSSNDLIKDVSLACDPNYCRTSVTLSGLRLPLRDEFLMRNMFFSVHYFVIVVKHGDKVNATKMVSTEDNVQAGRLVFNDKFCCRDLHKDFQICVEVYGLQTRWEQIDHERKYHLQEEDKPFNLFPAKRQRRDEVSSSVKPATFILAGRTTLNLRSLKNASLRLEEVSSESPLSGGLEMSLTIRSDNVVRRGYLVLRVISPSDGGEESDSRRYWCLMSGDHIYFFKSSDEKEEKEQFNLNLEDCVSDEVSCDSGNMFKLLIDRGQSSAVDCVMLTADSAAECSSWCSAISVVLWNLRAFYPMARQPPKKECC